MHELLPLEKYKAAEVNDVPVREVAGSTFPLVPSSIRDEESNDYDPFKHRKLSRPTSDLDTLIHLLKGSLGSGILSMPYAFLHAGAWFGLVATIFIGIICTYCIHILIKCAHILCRRRQIPSLNFADIAEVAFLDGPQYLHKYSRMLRFIVNALLCTDLLGCCCVYVLFVAVTIKQLIDHYFQTNCNETICIIALLIPLIITNLIRSLKYLTPFSLIANVFIAIGIVIILYYIINGIIYKTEPSDVEAIAAVSEWPIFFGNVIFALEGIGVVMSLENNMKNPTHFISCPGVLNIGMGVVITLYASVGFLGYLNYGSKTKPTVILNLPVQEVLAQIVKIMIAIAIFLTYTLQFYVPIQIIWRNFEGKLDQKYEYVLRIGFLILTVAIPVAVGEKLGPFITLIGAVCLSTLGLIVPAVIETVVYLEKPGMGAYNWRLFKNIFLILFGIVGFLTGTYVSIIEFTNHK